VNLRNVPEAERPPQESLEVDFDPWVGVEWTEGDDGGTPGAEPR
jgi:hypothetical protein